MWASLTTNVTPAHCAKYALLDLRDNRSGLASKVASSSTRRNPDTEKLVANFTCPTSSEATRVMLGMLISIAQTIPSPPRVREIPEDND